MNNDKNHKNIRKPRYSNYTVDPSLFVDLGSTGDQTNLPANYFQSQTGSNGSGLFDASSLIGKGLDVIQNIAVSIWGKGDKYRAQALQYINDEQKKTSTILWVIIGLMAVLGAVLLIRKS